LTRATGYDSNITFHANATDHICIKIANGISG
jgi:hypothetical protein